jgi:TRAP-type C4-dicarboxylate transport system permease small subunit
LSESAKTDAARPPSDRIGRYLHWSFGGLAALAIFALAVITFVDVLARYVFNSPIPGAYEVSELVMGVMIFAALPVVTWRGAHITVDFLDMFTPRRIAGWRDSLMFLLSSVVVAVLGWELWGLAETLASYGDVTEYLRIPIHPTLRIMSALAWATCGLALVASAMAARRALAFGRSSDHA